MLRRLNPGEFVQGTIFTCGLSDSYPAVAALGLLITARCDTAQDKTDVYNYVPVIPVEAWIERDGFELVAKRALANELGKMKSALTDAGMAHSIIEFVEHEAILAELNVGTSRQDKAVAKRFEQASRGMRAINKLLGSADRTREDVLEFLDVNEGLYKSVIKDLDVTP